MFRKKMSISRVDPSSFSPEVELVGLLICASYIARSAPGLGQLQHPLAFSGTSHIFQLQLHLGSPHSAPKKEQEEIGVSDVKALYSMFS